LQKRSNSQNSRGNEHDRVFDYSILRQPKLLPRRFSSELDNGHMKDPTTASFIKAFLQMTLISAALNRFHFTPKAHMCTAKSLWARSAFIELACRSGSVALKSKAVLPSNVSVEPDWLMSVPNL
jgi:hypothetical protein